MNPKLITRRQALTRVSASLGSIALASVFKDAELLADDALNVGTHPVPKAKHVIQIFAEGGPSQVDTFDPKPALNELEGKLASEVDKDYLKDIPKVASDMNRLNGLFFGSPFKFEKHGKSGIPVSDLFPKLAKQVDELCVIRSMHTKTSVHEPGQLMMNTGDQALVRPSLGSWAVYGLGSANRNLPSFVALHVNGKTSSGDKNWSNAFLPNWASGTGIKTNKMEVARMIEHLRSGSTSIREQRRQLDLLAEINREHLKNRSGQKFLEGRMASFETGFRMQVEASDAFDISREPRHVRELYGDTQQGKQLMLARRLVERGVRFVQTWHGGWDSHEDNDNRHRKLATVEADQSLAALIQDLKQRDLLKDTLVIWGGEFGRTPTTDVNGKRKIRGRDHNAGGFTIWMAGGGVKAGHIHGASDRYGAVATEGAMDVHDLHATILHLLGLNHEKLTYRHSGRDFRLTDVYGRVVKEILA